MRDISIAKSGGERDTAGSGYRADEYSSEGEGEPDCLGKCPSEQHEYTAADSV
jgi:hypothetical protein